MSDANPWCPVEATVDIISGKWKPLILFHLIQRPRRFNALRRLLPHVTQRMLTLQLRALEHDGIVVRTVHETVPPKVEYALSPLGWTLKPVFEAMEQWGNSHARPAAWSSQVELISPFARVGRP
jgi:DNA-binding HxlR family transcriptional regulator